MQQVQDYVTDVLAHMGVTPTTVVVEQKDDRIEVNIDLPEQESGMLIGHHGETIASLQRLANISFRTQELPKIVVNVNDYSEKRKESLVEMAERFAERAIETGHPQVLPFLPSHERLVIHQALTDHPEVETYSDGEGRQRRLIVALKQGSEEL